VKVPVANNGRVKNKLIRQERKRRDSTPLIRKRIPMVPLR
jgi:hypothetical protein